MYEPNSVTREDRTSVRTSDLGVRIPHTCDRQMYSGEHTYANLWLWELVVGVRHCPPHPRILLLCVLPEKKGKNGEKPKRKRNEICMWWSTFRAWNLGGSSG